MEVSLMLKKILIKVTRDEFDVLEQLMLLWCNSKKSESFDEKALYVLVFGVYTRKIMPQAMKFSPRITLNLSLPDAYALNFMLSDLNMNEWPYEQTLATRLMAEIHRQTV